LGGKNLSEKKPEKGKNLGKVDKQKKP